MCAVQMYMIIYILLYYNFFIFTGVKGDLIGQDYIDYWDDVSYDSEKNCENRVGRTKLVLVTGAESDFACD